jgi:hypothetical protein
MEVKEIVIVVVIASAFILLSYFTKRLTPDSKPKILPKYHRVFNAMAGISLLMLAWVFAPEGLLIPKILLSAYAILAIYRALPVFVRAPRRYR